MSEDKQPKKANLSRGTIRLVVEVGIIGIIIGFMVSVLADAFYEAVTGVDDTFELAFLVFWLIFAVLFLVLGVFGYRLGRTLTRSGYRFRAGGLLSWIVRYCRREISPRGVLISLAITAVCLALSFGFALLLTVLLWAARNPDMVP